ncbi:putative PGG domain-containing protein [Helianthus debilis subsp. tardiflorus]
MAAVKNDTPEVIEQITKMIPQSIWVNDEDSYRLPQISILNRCENVFNFLVHEVTHDKNLLTTFKDKDENNLLHLAGRLAPKQKLNMVLEVSKLVRPSEREATNLKEETPIMIFRKEHKALRQEGEEWMKKISDSYTITAALIITIVFAAAITVPGGNNGDTGKPLYETKPSFIIFAASYAISLFTSTTSLLLFLSILTSRYAEEDFLYTLPNKLILGLVMLFISVTSMMIAFSATLYIMFGQQKSWILIPIIALTCLPIASFVTLQLPLLVDIISSTYGHGIFVKRSRRA